MSLLIWSGVLAQLYYNQTHFTKPTICAYGLIVSTLVYQSSLIGSPLDPLCPSVASLISLALLLVAKLISYFYGSFSSLALFILYKYSNSQLHWNRVIHRLYGSFALHV